MAPVALRSSYAAAAALEPFFAAGSPARLSADGLRLVAATDEEARLVDAASGAVLATLPGDTEPLTALAFSPDGTRVYTASRSLSCRQWAVGGAVPACERTWRPHPLPVRALETDAQGTLLATCSADRTARVWDTARGHCTHALRGHGAPVLAAAFHPSAPAFLLLATSAEDGGVRVWDLGRGGACAFALAAHASAVPSLAVAPGPPGDPGHLLCAGRDALLTCWRLSDGSRAATVPTHEALEAVVALPPAPGAAPGALAGVRALTGGARGAARVWDVAAGRCLLEGPRDGAAAAQEAAVTSLQLLPGHAGAAAMTSDGRVLVYDAPAATGRSSWPSALTLRHTLLGDLEEVVAAVFLSDDSPAPRLAVATNSAVLRVLDGRSLACLASLAGHTDVVLAAAAPSAAAAAVAHARPSVALLASGGKDHHVRLWDAAAGACLASAEGHAGALTALAFGTASAALLLTGGADRLLKVWDCAPAIAAVPPATAPLRVVAAVAAHDKEVNCCAVAPGDALAASGGADRLIRLWSLPALLPRATLRGHRRGVWALAFSPVDAVVASASGDRTLRLWNTADGACLRTLEGHGAAALTVVWLAAGTQLASTGADGCLRVWAVAASECVATREAHDGRIWALDASADGAQLVTGGADGALRLWHDDTAEVAAVAAAAVEAAVADEHALARAGRRGDLRAALALGVRLGRPATLHALLAAAAEQPGAQATLQAAVAALPRDAWPQVLALCAEWNANARTCAVAQATLSALLAAAPLVALSRVPGAPPLIEAMHAHSQRHVARLDRLVRATYLLDFTLAQAGALLVEEEAAPADDEAPTPAAPSVIPTPVKRRKAAPEPAPEQPGGDDADNVEALPGWGAFAGGEPEAADEPEPEVAAPPRKRGKKEPAAVAEVEAPPRRPRRDAAALPQPAVDAEPPPRKGRKAVAQAAPDEAEEPAVTAPRKGRKAAVAEPEVEPVEVPPPRKGRKAAAPPLAEPVVEPAVKRRGRAAATEAAAVPEDAPRRRTRKG